MILTRFLFSLSGVEVASKCQYFSITEKSSLSEWGIVVSVFHPPPAASLISILSFTCLAFQMLLYLVFNTRAVARPSLSSNTEEGTSAVRA
jgi:hypothetical protein